MLETTFPFELSKLDPLKRVVLSPDLLIALWEQHINESCKDVPRLQSVWGSGDEVFDDNIGREVVENTNGEVMEDTIWNLVRRPHRKGRRSRKTLREE